MRGADRKPAEAVEGDGTPGHAHPARFDEVERRWPVAGKPMGVDTAEDSLLKTLRKIGAPVGKETEMNSPRFQPTEVAEGPLRMMFARAAAKASYDPQRLARLCCVSLRQLQRQFRIAFGCTPRAWLKDFRMVAASRLLAQSVAVKEVAFHLSYKQPSHFTREFKGYFGLPPSRFSVRREDRATRDVWPAPALAGARPGQGRRDGGRPTLARDVESGRYGQERYLPGRMSR